jgi:hypothetical protein
VYANFAETPERELRLPAAPLDKEEPRIPKKEKFAESIFHALG